jgi:membrane protein implicated in regulation of membrane protease activity
MPLDRLVLILVVVLAAAGATVWVGALVAASWALHPAAPLVALLPTALVAFVLWRVVAERLSSREDDRYDRIRR